MNKPLHTHELAQPDAPEHAMPDVQSKHDDRHLAITQVGVRGVRTPVHIALQNGATQASVATWELSVALPPEKKGTHMSRFVAMLMAHFDQQQPLDAAAMRRLAQDMLPRLGASDGRISVSFTLFIKKTAPVSGVQSFMDYQAGYDVTATEAGVRVDAKIVAPVKSLCPCSKEISSYGAHNQRSHISICAELLEGKPAVSFEQLIRYAEEEASSEIWALLKRPDEKYITEHAYDNPKFVEDLVRDVAIRLNADAGVGAYVLEAENFESIHNHSAYAKIVR